MPRAMAFHTPFQSIKALLQALWLTAKNNLPKKVLSAFIVPTDNDRNVQVRRANINIRQGENLDFAFTKVYNCELKDGEISVTGSLAGVPRVTLLDYVLNIDISESVN